MALTVLIPWARDHQQRVPTHENAANEPYFKEIDATAQSKHSVRRWVTAVFWGAS